MSIKVIKYNDSKFKSTEFIVEANNFERGILIKKFGKDYTWNVLPHIYEIEVGTLNNHSIYISIRWVKINNVHILFWTPVSSIVDRQQILLFFHNYCPQCPNYDVSAESFHRCLAFIEQRIEPIVCESSPVLTPPPNETNILPRPPGF